MKRERRPKPIVDLDWDTDDEPYSDELLDAIESFDGDLDDDDDGDYLLGGRSALVSDDGDDFDAFFRNAESHAHDRRRDKRRNPYRDDRFDYGVLERYRRDSHRRRPRR